MLDDLKYIHQRDGKDALGIAAKQADQYKHDYKFQWQAPRPVQQVVVAGMGGSGLAATAAKSWPGLNVPFEVSQAYELPASVDQNTLVILSSYSGNTEETLASCEQALSAEQQPMVVIVASGGKLLEIAKAQQLPYVQLPGGYQPRMTFGYQLRGLLEIFQAVGLCQGVVGELEQAADWLAEELQAWLPAVAAKSNLAKLLAQECMGKSPVVYAGPKLFPAAYKWKISFNENAKNVAWFGRLSEFDHNEFIGWASHPVDKPYTVIDLRSSLEHPRIQKRFELAEKLLSGRRPAPEIVQAKGETLPQQLLWTIALGDFVSIYLALLNGVDPTPVDLVEKLKQALND